MSTSAENLVTVGPVHSQIIAFIILKNITRKESNIAHHKPRGLPRLHRLVMPVMKSTVHYNYV